MGETNKKRVDMERDKIIEANFTLNKLESAENKVEIIQRKGSVRRILLTFNTGSEILFEEDVETMELVKDVIIRKLNQQIIEYKKEIDKI